MTTALLIIDMQGFVASRTAAGRERVNPDAEQRTADLLALFRARGLPVSMSTMTNPAPPSRLIGPTALSCPAPCRCRARRS